MKNLGGACSFLWILLAQNVFAVENMSFRGTLREDIPCEINRGQATDIDFEIVGVKKIDGERYKKLFPLDITCPGGFTVPFKVSYVGQPSDFDASALTTNIKGLGIKAKYKINGGFSELAVGGYMEGTGSMTYYLQVVPVRKLNSVLEPGAFNANASFRLEYY